MELEWDEEKRQETLAERGLDFAEAGEIFNGYALTFEDDREDYHEERMVSFGRMKKKIVACVWTDRPKARRIISLRRADKDEREIYLYHCP